MKIDYEIDLGAEKLLEAEKGSEKIAVEIKSFLKTSLVNEFHGVLGQYLVYREGLLRLAPNRKLYLAIPYFADLRLEEHKFLQELIKQYDIKIVVFDTENHIIVQWKN